MLRRDDYDGTHKLKQRIILQLKQETIATEDGLKLTKRSKENQYYIIFLNNCYKRLLCICR